jgi:hypothetical protein
MAKLSNQHLSGTSFYGLVVYASVNELIEILGNPQYQSNNGRDNINFEWTCETDGGDVFTIYDWKEYKSIPNTKKIEWHIGGHSRHDTEIAASELSNNCYNIFQE